MTPTEILQAGCHILQPTLAKHGFALVPGSSGRGSGGDFASASFQRGDRRLELHFRHSLGLVTYRLGGAAVSHDDYVRVVLSDPQAAKYPGFSEDPLDGFRHLKDDLDRFGTIFLAGTDEALSQVLAKVAALPRGIQTLSRPEVT